MDAKKKIIIVWRFSSQAKEIALDNYHIKPISIKDQYITDEQFEALYDELKSTESDAIAFLHQPNFKDDHMKQLISSINRDRNILVLEFSGGSGALYTEFIDQQNQKLKDSEITSENIEGKIKDCIEKCDITPKLIQLHKRLILEKLNGKHISEDMLDDLKEESEDIKIAINTISEAKRKDENVLLDYISNEVAKYGA